MTLADFKSLGKGRRLELIIAYEEATDDPAKHIFVGEAWYRASPEFLRWLAQQPEESTEK